ncbi:MAG: ABC transporter ATP-binding protein [Lachnospiraceae bacterium]|nr:ABC transporter ATP-binding protein [Lachnospiraceae bacterium]
MKFESVLEIKNMVKKFKGFELNIPELNIPAGLATALIGENGAGKTTLMNAIAGIRIDYEGSIKYFGKYNDEDRENGPEVKNAIGYTGTDTYYLPHWTIRQVSELSEVLYDGFDAKRFEQWCSKLAISGNSTVDMNKKVTELSDGTRTKLMLAGVLSRDTDMLLLDEPASPLDPLMRDRLCELMREYLGEKEGRSIFFSTHNISDMENVTDYAVIMEHGNVVEQGYVDDLKEKYILVKGEAADALAAKKVLYTISESKYGFEGICLAEDLDKLAGMDISTEIASLFQISVAVMKKNSYLQ